MERSDVWGRGNRGSWIRREVVETELWELERGRVTVGRVLNPGDLRKYFN